MEASGHQFARIFDDLFDVVLMFFVKRGASTGDAKNIVLYWYLQYSVAVGFLTKGKKGGRRQWPRANCRPAVVAVAAGANGQQSLPVPAANSEPLQSMPVPAGTGSVCWPLAVVGLPRLIHLTSFYPCHH